MPFNETQTGTRRIYEGKIISLRVDEIETAEGYRSTREVVEHPGGVGVLALDGEDRVLLVRQFRYAVGREVLEIPAGKLNAGEDPGECGRRELEEETGFVAGEYRRLGQIYPTPAYVTEIIHLYLARDLRPGSQNLDPGEFLAVEKVPFAEVVERCLSGEICDAKTVAAILQLQARRAR